jgi:hypothetical protein
LWLQASGQGPQFFVVGLQGFEDCPLLSRIGLVAGIVGRSLEDLLGLAAQRGFEFYGGRR